MNALSPRPSLLAPASRAVRAVCAVLLLTALGAPMVGTPRGVSAQAIKLAHDRLHHYVHAPTVVAARSGAWSDAATWKEGALPGEGARVWIPAGVTVSVDREIAAPHDWLNVEGTLRFEPAATTALAAHTIVVMDSGQLEIGTAAQPVTGRATLTLTSRGRDIDHAVDPLELTLGLIVMGQARIHGAPKTSWVPVTAAPAAGATRIRPERLPEGWGAGDRLVLTASTYGQEEELTFERIENGEVVVAQPLRHARVFPEAGLSVHAANLSRTVVVRSDPADAGNVRRQAHVMLMSDPRPHDVRYAEFRDLGRTTIGPVSDPRILSDGTRDPSLCPPLIADENIRGRYALHFHHVGERTAPVPHHVQGVSIHVKKRARLKVGLVNHSSHVIVEDSVGYNIDGSTFMTEEGNEVGAFLRNLAVSSFGSNLRNEDQPRDIHLRNTCPELAQRRRGDMGHNGSGFWVHSGGVDVIGNVAAGHTNAGFDLWTIPLHRPNAPPRLEFERKYLRKRSRLSFGAVPIDRVPALFRDNVAYAAGFERYGRQAGIALSHGLHAHKDRSLGKSLFEGFVAWNVAQGIDSEYTSSTVWRQVRILAGARAPGTIGIGLRRQAAASDNEVHGARVAGFKECLQLGDNGELSDVHCADGTMRGPGLGPGGPRRP